MDIFYYIIISILGLVVILRILHRFLRNIIYLSIVTIFILGINHLIDKNHTEYIPIYTTDFKIVGENFIGNYSTYVKYTYNGVEYTGNISNVPERVYNNRFDGNKLQLFINPNNLNKVYMEPNHIEYDKAFIDWCIIGIFSFIESIYGKIKSIMKRRINNNKWIINQKY